MMGIIVLDTNVLSEPLRLQPSRAVEAWAASMDPALLYTTAITVGELCYGIARLPEGRRRDGLKAGIDAALAALGAGHVLPYDQAAAQVLGDIIVERERVGRPIQRADAQIAAICRYAGAALATRNTVDFENLGLDLIDPWSFPAA